MRKRLVALLLAVAILLSGCNAQELKTFFRSALELYGIYMPIHYNDMQYVHPDISQVETSLEENCGIIENAQSPDEILNAVFSFYAAYDHYYTMYALADIRYSCDLSDTYWQEEYDYCAENLPTVDAGLEELYHCIAASPLRNEQQITEYFGEGFFDAYEGEPLRDDTFVALLEQEANLVSEYYALCDEAASVEFYSEDYFSRYGTQLAQLYVEMVALRQEIAEYAGYPSYPLYAYDCIHYRDYTPQQVYSYLNKLSEVLCDLYMDVNAMDVWDSMYEPCDEGQTLAYTKAAAEAIGGIPAQAFRHLETSGVYDIVPGENKFDNAFEIYLWDYSSPFIFMNPYGDQTDKLTFAHEFGHFCNDFACGGSYAGTDVAEVHSQGFEYLSLCYGGEELTQYKLADSLCVYMENAAYALFEQLVYNLKAEDLTVENVQALYERVGKQFGFDSWAWDSRDYVTVPHFVAQPMYVIGYVVSNDLALQIYEKELAQPGAGIALYENCLSSHDGYLLQFAQTYGLKSPFDTTRLGELETLFGNTFK